jgi:hypothetical protein
MEKLFLRLVDGIGLASTMDEINEQLNSGWSVKQIVLSPEVVSTHFGSSTGKISLAVVIQKSE